MPTTKHNSFYLPTKVRPTTFLVSPRLNKKLNLDLTIASETFQITGSFKFRAAYNVASNVPNKRIITASSGNFGQALAYACQLLDKEAIIVMPNNSAAVKIAAVKEYGGIVEIVDTKSKSRAARVAELSKQFPDAYIASAYDDPLVIEGNASLGREIADHESHFDVVLVPIGGGGLASGIILGAQQRSRTDMQIIGVEPALANDASRSFKSGSIVENELEPQTVADGARTLSVGQHNWSYLQRGLQNIIEVSEDTIAQTTRLLFSLANLKVEPTGAVAVAGALTVNSQLRDKKICCIASGGNVDIDRFTAILCNQPLTDC